MESKSLRVLALGLLGTIAACSSTTETGTKAVDGSAPATGGAVGAGGSVGAGGTGGSIAAGGASGSGGFSGGSTDSGGVAGSGGSLGSGGAGGSAPNACVQAGGICECSCGAGTSASPSLLSACPQPCPLCGGCGQQCCLPIDGPFPCGTQTCTKNQVCVRPCSGTAPQPPPHCTDVPPACGTTVTCGCLPSDVCGGAGTCTNASFYRLIMCQGCA
jgi:hypothetical protein